MAQMGSAMSVLGVMPVYIKDEKTEHLTRAAVNSFFQCTPGVRLIAIDDGSPNREAIEALSKKVPVITKPNEGFAKTVNVGLRTALENDEGALLINADIHFIERRWAEWMCNTDADIVGAKLLYPNHGLVQHAGIYYSAYTRLFSHIGRFAPADTPELNVERECPVTGALQLIKHSALEKLGLYDEGFQFGFEDVDYCIRAKQAGLKVVYQPKAIALHHESAFRGPKPPDWIKERMDQSWNYFQEKHAGTDIASIVPTLLN
jgi:GT2 family glycosyltransferase